MSSESILRDEAIAGAPLQEAPAEAAIVVADVSKCYQLYERPEHRLKQALMPRVQRLFGRAPGRYFRESWALREVGFSIARGETVGIIGRNGSGKSTLLQIVCGTLTPTHGRVERSGRIGALLELGSGFNPEFTGRENVHMNGAILGMSPEEIAAKYDAIVAFADIGDFIEQPVKTYSSGMYVRLAFAVIAHADADILVIDEALSVGDVFFAQKCMRFLRDFQKRGTVLFVSHDASAIVNLCDRAIWLDGGRVAMDGVAKDVCEAYHASTYGDRPRTLSPNTGAGNAGADPSLRDNAVALPADDLRPRLDRSLVEVFRFDPERQGFGDGGSTIESVHFEDMHQRALNQVSGGEIIRLVVLAKANRDIRSPIVGFFLKDRLGQQLFGTNTCIGDGESPSPVMAGGRIRAEFEFCMPYLPRGRYTIDIAVADGTYLQHVQTCWVYDALVFESLFIPRSTGLVGIPYRAIRLDVSEADVVPQAGLGHEARHI